MQQNRKVFGAFPDETDFPDPLRQRKQGPDYSCPEWLIMFITILSVMCELKIYCSIHRIVSSNRESIFCSRSFSKS